jgi:MSHA biogenesis protein MshP
LNKPYISTMSHKQGGRTLKKQSGSALLIAVFVIIVISLLGASLMSLQRDSAQGTSYEIYAARAYLAAYSASEIALTQLFPLGASEASAANCTGNKIEPTLPSDTAGFHGCGVNYTCNIISSAVATRYKVVSTATCKNSQINTRRQITVEASSL